MYVPQVMMMKPNINVAKNGKGFKDETLSPLTYVYVNFMAILPGADLQVQ